MRQMVRLAGLGIMLFVAGCNGFPDAPPISEAEHRPEKYPGYETAGEPTVISTDGQRWVVLAGATDWAPAWLLQSVAIGGGGELFSVRGDPAPHGVLFARLPDGLLRRAAQLH